MRFRDREDAGRRLAARLLAYRGSSPLVLGLPRGGVPVAYEVATALGGELDVWVVRKVGAPWHEELGMGAVSEGGEVYLQRYIIDEVGATNAEVAAIVEKKKAEVEARCAMFRQGKAGPEIAGRTVIVVDDGIATGGTARVALRAIRKRGPKKLVLAVPVADEEVIDSFRQEADEVICVAPVQMLTAVGLWYEDFTATSDDEVVALLDRAKKPAAAAAKGGEGEAPRARP